MPRLRTILLIAGRKPTTLAARDGRWKGGGWVRIDRRGQAGRCEGLVVRSSRRDASSVRSRVEANCAGDLRNSISGTSVWKSGPIDQHRRLLPSSC